MIRSWRSAGRNSCRSPSPTSSRTRSASRSFRNEHAELQVGYLLTPAPSSLMAIVPLERKPLTFAERTYVPQILLGLKTTWKHLVKPKKTLQYPEDRPAIPPGYRGVPTLVKDPNGREKCVSWQLCEFVCPPKAIRIRSEARRGGSW